MPRLYQSSPRLTFVVLAAAAAAFSLMQSLVTPVLPTIQAGLHTSQNTVTWVLTAYLLSASIFTPILGRLGDMTGKKRMFVLALSALAKSAEQIMPLLVVAIMSQLVFSGGLIPVTGRVVLDQLSWVTPARWGFASSASTVDLTRLVPPPLLPDDPHWKHTSSAWLFDMGILVALCIFYTGFVRWKIRLPRA